MKHDAKTSWMKTHAIPNTRALYETAGHIQQCKSHGLCLLKQSSVAIFHGAQSHSESLRKLQRDFVRELGLTEEDVFLEHQFTPLELRR